MPADNLPRDVIRILSFHGPVSWWVGGESALARGEAATAPFEDIAYLFMPAGGAGERALLQSTRMIVGARSAEGTYNLKMEGRAHAGVLLARHPRRAEIAPWAPEGSNANRTVVVPFTAEHIELVRTDGEVASRYVGPTPAGKERPQAQSIWLRAALGGLVSPFALFVPIGVWTFLALRGPEYPFRPLALILAILGGLLPLAGARLVMLSRAFLGWRDGKVRAGEAQLFEDALLAPQVAESAGVRMLLLGFALLLMVMGIWEAALGGLALGLSGVWVLAPAWAVHLSMAEPKR